MVDRKLPVASSLRPDPSLKGKPGPRREVGSFRSKMDTRTGQKGDSGMDPIAGKEENASTRIQRCFRKLRLGTREKPSIVLGLAGVFP